MIVTEAERHLLPVALAMVDGCFDPVHPGHLAYFRRARALGVPVLCNAACDGYIRGSKGRPPLLPEADRAVILDGFRDLDYVFITRHGTAWSLEFFRPRYYVKGIDWRGRLPEEQVRLCAEHAIEIVYADCPLDSSTRILETFLGNYHARQAV